MATVASNNNSPQYLSGYIVKEATKAFMNDRLFSGLVRSEYRSDFEERGAKKGDTIYVRRAAQFRVRDGAGMEIQAVHEDKLPVTLPDQKGVDFQFSARELTLDIDKGGNEYSKRFIRPAGSALASDFDALGMKTAANTAGSVVIVKAADSDDVLYSSFLKAKARLNKFLAPKNVNERHAIIDSDIENRLAQNVKQLYNNANAISKAIKDGTIQDVAGLTWGTSDLSYVHENGGGGETFTLSDFTPDYENLTQWVTYTGAADLAIGDTVEFNNTYFVNPETKLAYTDKLQRKILDLSSSTSGQTTTKKAKIYSIRTKPTTITTELDRQHYAQTNASATPTAGTVLGIKDKRYLCCPVFHMDSIVLTCVDLARPKKVEMVNSVNYKNVVIRFIEDYSIDKDQFPDRLDMMGVFTSIIPEWCVDVEIELT